jgi:hypothetical protein
MRLTVAMEFGLEREPHLTCSLHRFSNGLMEFRGEGAKDSCHHDVFQSSPIDGWVGDVEEDVVVQGIMMKREKHDVMPPLVVGRRGIQNDHDHWSYVQDVGSVCRCMMRAASRLEPTSTERSSSSSS